MGDASSNYISIRVARIEEKIKGFKTFEFEEGHHISYKAGQYLTFVQRVGREEVRRSYSISSSPVLDEQLTIGVKRIENGLFSRFLIDKAQPGDWLQTTGSGGLFTLPDESEEFGRLAFFAAGSGITPILSLVKTALHVNPYIQVVLVFSNSSVEKAVFLDEIKAIHLQYTDRFHLELLFSNSPNLLRARLHRDLILQLLKDLINPDTLPTLYYTCGPESYMWLCTYTLQEAGIQPKNIKRENFIVHHFQRRDAAPPDKSSYHVRLRIKQQEYHFSIEYPDSILKAAQKEGIALPYSCEAGRCGNCVAICTKGTVWHSYNEVLTERELSKGMVLTCVGHPVGGDIDL